MITQAENGKSLPLMSEEVSRWFERVKDFFHEQHTESLTVPAQKAANTITTATDNTINSVSATVKDSLEQTLQKVNDVNSATTNAMQTAINNSVNEWLQAHPLGLRLVQILVWGTNHPIISIIILLFAIALVWSLIKAIGRFIETLALSLLQVPLKSAQAFFKFSTNTLRKSVDPIVNQILPNKTTKIVLQDPKLTKQQKLAEISTRLELLQQEQKQLLQEVAEILALDEDNTHCLTQQPASKITNQQINNSHVR